MEQASSPIVAFPRQVPGSEGAPSASHGSRHPGGMLPPELAGSVERASELLRAARRGGTKPPLPTGLPALDRLLGGGLPRGGIVELTAPRAAGRMGVVLAALATVTGGGEPAVLADLGGHLDPVFAEAAGVELPRLLWLRPGRLPEAMELAETFLQTEIPLVVLELGLPPVRGRVATAAWMRLRRAAAAHGNTLLVASPWRLSGHTAELVLSLEGSSPRWNRRRGAAPLLEGVLLSLRLLRRRSGTPGATARQELRVAEALFQPIPEGATTAPAIPRGARPEPRTAAAGA